LRHQEAFTDLYYKNIDYPVPKEKTSDLRSKTGFAMVAQCPLFWNRV